MRLAILTATLLATLLAAPLLALPASGAATGADAPVLSFTTDPDVPVRINHADSQGLTEPVQVSLHASTTATHVTLTATGDDDLVVDPATRTFDTVDAGRTVDTTFGVAARAPGLHTLTVTATADGADPVTLTLPRLWLAGGRHLPGHDPLSMELVTDGTGFNEDDTTADGFNYVYDVRFIDPHHVTLGGATSCRTGRCQPYHYDARTHLVQIGTSVIGLVDHDHDRLDGLVDSDPSDTGELYVGTDLTYVRPAPARRRLAGDWVFDSTVGTVRHERLTLTRNRTYVLVVRTYTTENRYAGRYRIATDGHLTLLDRHGHRTLMRTGLSLGCYPGGAHAAGRLGVFLTATVHERHGRRRTTERIAHLLLPGHRR